MPRKLVRETMTVKAIRHCARCGKDHTHVTFVKMIVPISDEEGLWEWYGICPSNGDPILMRTLSEPITLLSDENVVNEQNPSAKG